MTAPLNPKSVSEIAEQATCRWFGVTPEEAKDSRFEPFQEIIISAILEAGERTSSVGNEAPVAYEVITETPQKPPPLDATNHAWRRKELWSRRGDQFCVEVSRHFEPISTISPELGEHRWCVYAYIYPKHPHFQKFDGTDYFFQDACAELPLHGGVIGNASYLRYHYAGGGQTTCIQVGADYNHLHDERFTHMTPEEAGEVFFDAELLFLWLTDSNKASDRPGADSVGHATDEQSAAPLNEETVEAGNSHVDRVEAKPESLEKEPSTANPPVRQTELSVILDELQASTSDPEKMQLVKALRRARKYYLGWRNAAGDKAIDDELATLVLTGTRIYE